MAKTLIQTFPRLGAVYVCYWPTTWHLLLWFNDLDAAINHSTRFMKQHSTVYLGRQRVRNWIPPTQKSLSTQPLTHTTLIASNSFLPVISEPTFSPDSPVVTKRQLKKKRVSLLANGNWPHQKKILPLHEVLPADVIRLLDH